MTSKQRNEEVRAGAVSGREMRSVRRKTAANRWSARKLPAGQPAEQPEIRESTGKRCDHEYFRRCGLLCE